MTFTTAKNSFVVSKFAKELAVPIARVYIHAGQLLSLPEGGLLKATEES